MAPLGRALYGVMLLAMAGYLAVMVWTFTGAERVQARVDPCDAPGTGRCTGSWQVDGRTEHGRLINVARHLSGSTVPVRLGPLGAIHDRTRDRVGGIGLGALALVVALAAPWADRRRARRPRPTGP